MTDRKIALSIDGHSIRPRTARHLNKDADLAGGTILHQWYAPDRVVARDCEEHDVLIRIEHEPVRARHIVEDAVELAVTAQAIKTAGRILKAGLALIGEIDVAIPREDEIVRALEPLQHRPVEIWFDLSAARVEHHDPVAVVGDECAAVLVKLQSVRLSIIFGRNAYLARRRDLEDAAPGNIDHEQIAVAIE